MMKKITALLLAGLMILSLAACGGNTDASTAPAKTEPAKTEAAKTEPAKTEAAQTDAPTDAPDDGSYKYRTDDTTRFATENGNIPADLVKTPVLVTSAGQSPDSAMLKSILRKVGLTEGTDFIDNKTATAADVENAGLLIVVAGASTKGMGNAGISKEDEEARIQEVLKAAADKNIPVFMFHLGGSSRRGGTSDRFSTLVMAQAKYMMVVEEGNTDDFFTKYAKDNNLPITLLKSIADSVTPLTELFGK